MPLQRLVACCLAALIGGLLLGQGTASGASPGDDMPVWLVADQRLTITTAAGSGALALYLSKDWTGRSRRSRAQSSPFTGSSTRPTLPGRSRKWGRARSGLDPDSVLFIEPQFLDDVDVAALHLPADTLHWSHTGWEGGDDAHGPAPISSFTALDAILARLADRTAFPALKSVVIAGHSGGGQLVQRYAVGMAEAQGPNRYARGLAYYRYLKWRHPTGLAHRLMQVPQVGHDSDGMLNSSCGLAALYDLPGCDGG